MKKICDTCKYYEELVCYANPPMVIPWDGDTTYTSFRSEVEPGDKACRHWKKIKPGSNKQ